MRSASREARLFRNNLALLKSIDRHELEEAEVIKGGPDGYGDWIIYLTDPVDFILRLAEDPLDRFYEILERRS
jgi:hypothetical protein